MNNTPDNIVKLNTIGIMTPLLEILPFIPDKHLTLGCKYAWQYNEWYTDKSFYTDLNHMLTCYFIGKSLPKSNNEIYQKILVGCLDFWLKFYDLLYFGWEFIEMEAERSRLSLEGIGASSPGEALKLILYNQSTHDFLQVKSHHLEYSPQKAHKRLKQIINALQSENPEDQHIQESISDPKYKQLGVEYETDLNHFYNFCVFVLIKNRNNQRITKRWNAFTGEVLETAKLIKKLTHPSQKRTGFVQENERRHKNP